MLKAFFFGALIFFLPIIGLAQSVRDQVKDHVKDSLDKETDKAGKKKDREKQDKKEKKKTEKKKDKNKSTGPSSNDDFVGNSGDPALQFQFDSKDQKQGASKEEKGPKLPRRVIHKYFQLDLEAGIGYRGWTPQQYPNVNVDMASFFTWAVSFNARFFKLVSLRKGYFESNYMLSPRAPYFSDAAKIGSPSIKAAWFLLELGVPIVKAWEPVLRYETRSFQTTASVERGHEVCIVSYGYDSSREPCTKPGDGSERLTEVENLQVVSAFENAVVGVRYYPSRNPSGVIQNNKGMSPSLMIGAAYLSYLKPYQVTIGDFTLNDLIFTGRFRGGGLALGTDIGKGVNSLIVDIWAQIGIGKVNLTKDLSLNELAPQDWMIGYLQGNAKLMYRWAPFKFAPTIMLVPDISLSGATFFFFKTKVDEGEETATPSINWDILYSARLSLVITL